MNALKKFFGWFPFKIGFGIFMSLLMPMIYLTGAFDGFEHRWSDAMFRARGMIKADPRITIVTIDNPSIAAIGRYPWQRRVYARLIDQLTRYKVKTIAFDVLFVDKTTSFDDNHLIAATRRAKRVVHSMFVEHLASGDVNIAFPIPGLKAASAMVAQVDVGGTLDTDGSVRRVRLFEEVEGKQVPLLGLGALCHFQGVSPEVYREKFPGLLTLNVRGERSSRRRMVVGGEEKILEGREYAFRRIPVIRVLNGELTEEEKQALRGGLAVVGSVATGAFDHYPSPFDRQSPGVEVHTNVMDNLLQGDYLKFLSWPVTVLVILGAIWGVIALAGLPPWLGGLCVFGGLALLGILDYILFLKTYRLELVAPSFSGVAAFMVLSVQRIIAEQRAKQQIQGMFGQYVSPEVVGILVKDPSKIKLGGDKREMSAFFLDIAHFTSISEKMSPEALVQFLNKYLSALTEVIHRNNGVVDKYIGDCIMAFWNAPLDEPNHRALACLSAVECIEVLNKLNSELDPGLSEKPDIRIGLNSGPMVVGNTGSEKKKAYTVLGDEVNLASRLEGANKYFGSSIMASESVYKEAADVVEARELGKVRVVGKEVPILVYELLARKDRLPEDRKNALTFYNEGIKLFKAKKFKEAKSKFEAGLKVLPDDKPARFYVKTCEEHLLKPPSADWDGVFNLTAK